ncbi:MAG: ribonuclease E inhibitor RraB [Pseudorhodobacter sp.]
MAHDFKAQRAETFDTFREIGNLETLPKHAVVNFLFLADDLDAPFEKAMKSMKNNGFETYLDRDEMTLEARIGPMEITASAIWAEEKRATEIMLPFGFDPDGWELLE